MADLMQQARELLPCPFCGCAATLRVGERMLVDAHVICEGCSAEGPGFGADATEGDFTMEALEAWNRRAAPEGFVMVPVEPTPERLAAAALAVLAPANGDMELARRAAQIVIQSADAPHGITVDIIAASIATMAPAYRAMLAARPQGVKDA